MRVSWMERKTNVWVLENMKPELTLRSRVAQAALRYYGNVVREERGMENDVMIGEMNEKRRRGRPITRWLDNVNNLKGPFKVSYGQRSFSYSAPSAWISLPQQVRSSDNVSTFRSRTKTHVFRLAY